MFIAERVISLVAPHNCINCGREGSLLCAWCSPEVILPVPSRCYKCARKTDNFAVCDTHKRLSPLRHVLVVSEYEHVAKELITKLKFERASGAAITIAGLLDDNLPIFPKDAIFTYLPTVTTRRRQRGYDQSQLIAKSFTQKRRYTYADLLGRLGQSRQVGSKREQRLSQALESYYPLSPRRIQNKHIILIDDIVTTGASLESAAKVLKMSGAKKVDAIVFATAK